MHASQQLRIFSGGQANPLLQLVIPKTTPSQHPLQQCVRKNLYNVLEARMAWWYGLIVFVVCAGDADPHGEALTGSNFAYNFIHQHQHPSDCGTAKYLIHVPHRSGIGELQFLLPWTQEVIA